jgi:hypothetical protein
MVKKENFLFFGSIKERRKKRLFPLLYVHESGGGGGVYVCEYV